MAFFEGGRESTLYHGHRVRLFYWNFTAEDSYVTSMLSALGDYLDGDYPDRNDTTNGKLVRYNVIEPPFNYYDFNNTNCFRAVAKWTDFLGKSQLQTIYNNAMHCRDYFAYKLANWLASTYWVDMGIRSY